nr:hypothetical protein [Tanacetum cinerariifolium]
MVAILEKIEYNTEFHQIVDFLEASHIRYALTISPTIYVSHIRQFWSTARIETTISESSLRRHLKLNDEEGISSLPDAKLFEHLSLIGYNILPNQRTIPLFASMIITQGEGSANPTEPHHTPSPQEHQSPPSANSPHHDSPPPSHQPNLPEPIPHDLQASTATFTPRRLTKRAIRIAQSKALSPDADEPTSLSRGARHGKDSGCSRHMTKNIFYLFKYEPYDGGYVSFGHGGGKITEKQHKASCKTKLVNSVSKPLYTLYMDLFRATSVSSLNHKWCDNGGEFKNQEMNEFCTMKCIRREFSIARTPQQNRVAKRRNITLIEVARTMLADAKLPNKLIEKGACPNWLFDIDILTNSMNYVPVVVAGTSSTNISAHMETSNDTIRNSDAQDDSQKEQDCNADVPESSGISNLTATLKAPSTDQVEHAVSLTVESKILTVSSPIPTVCLDISPKSSSGPRLTSKRVFSQNEAPSLGNALTLSNRFEDTFGDTTNAVTLNKVEADLSNMETSITEEPKKIFDALKDLSWVEALQEELLQFKIHNVWVLVDCPKRTHHDEHHSSFDPPEGGEKGEKILTFPGIEAHALYLIVDKPDTGLIYLNGKDEKRVMYLVEIVKLCDATLEKVLNEVKLRIFQNAF